MIDLFTNVGGLIDFYENSMKTGKRQAPYLIFSKWGLVSISRLTNRKYGSFIRQITSGFGVKGCRFY